ncbi:MAG TPA: DUF2934 domain-containing protein [Gemmatimonadaceae bacterium]|nr:DUF2934 domain-containing protein [Gemmatimonadaceae bacterium]
MKNDRRESADVEVSGGEVIRGDAAPVEQEESLGAEEAIRARAYELYLQRGEGSAGDEMNDWLEAEREYHERRGESGGYEARDQPGG